MSANDDYLLWESADYSIHTLANPHIPYKDGMHLVVRPKNGMANAWQDPKLAAKTFELAATAAGIIERTGLAPWFNIEAKGNWGLLPGKTPHFHIHIYGRNKTKMWGKPLVLPELPGTFSNAPMPEKDRQLLISAFRRELNDY